MNKFTIFCLGCRHNNQFSPSPLQGIIRVLTGESISCNGCKKQFIEIRVPNRPVVSKLVMALSSLNPQVKIVDYAGKLPKALGIIA